MKPQFCAGKSRAIRPWSGTACSLTWPRPWRRMRRGSRHRHPHAHGAPGDRARPRSRPRNFEIDTHPEQITLLAAGVPAFDDDAARYNSVEKAFELRGARTYSCFDGIARV